MRHCHLSRRAGFWLCCPGFGLGLRPNISQASTKGTASMAIAHSACSRSVPIQVIPLQMAAPGHQVADFAAGHTGHDLVHDF
jgi:hypothetical protein